MTTFIFEIVPITLVPGSITSGSMSRTYNIVIQPTDVITVYYNGQVIPNSALPTAKFYYTLTTTATTATISVQSNPAFANVGYTTSFTAILPNSDMFGIGFFNGATGSTGMTGKTGSTGLTGALPTPNITSVSLYPSTLTIAPGTTQQFTAQVNGIGAITNTFTWTSLRGTITSSGLYTSPLTGSADAVTVTCTQNLSKTNVCFVNISAPIIPLNGATGATGAIGATGQGNTGVAGVTGQMGQTGSQGNTGNTGASGANGNNGYTGIGGIAGSKGNTGATGADGIVGPTGPIANITFSPTGITVAPLQQIQFVGTVTPA